MSRVLGTVRRYPRQLLLCAVAAISVASAYTSAFVDLPSRERPTRPAVRPAQAVVKLSGLYALEPGLDGLGWSWLHKRGVITVKGLGRRWLAFRALSHDRTRRLTFRGRNLPTQHVRVRRRPRPFIVGPFQLSGTAFVAMNARPGPVRAGIDDPRKVSIFLSQPELVPDPVAALPGAGFYPAEQRSDGEVFNWMAGRGSLYAAITGRKRVEASLELRIESAVEARRTVTIAGGDSTVSFVAPPRGEPRVVTAGPFSLRRGDILRLVVSPRPRPVPPDPRPLGLRVFSIRLMPTGAGG